MKNSRKRSIAQAGVTLIEMLVVVTIIALFAALVAPRFLNKTDNARRVAAKAQINGFMTALGAYKLDTGLFPTTEQGLAVLRAKPEGLTQWNGPYLPQDIPNDPWGHPYVYASPGQANPSGFDLQSYGRDGRPGGEGEDADLRQWEAARR